MKVLNFRKITSLVLAVLMMASTLTGIHLSFAREETTQLQVPTFAIEYYDGDSWELLDSIYFQKTMTTRSFTLPSDVQGSVKVKLTQRGGAKGFIDCITIDNQNPESLSGEMLRKLQAIDLDILQVPMEGFVFDFDNITSNQIVVTGRIEHHNVAAVPFKLGFVDGIPSEPYNVSTSSGALELGNLPEVSTAFGVYHTVPQTGHPEGDATIWVENDDEFLYIVTDWTSDNTFDDGDDYFKVYVSDGLGTVKEYIQYSDGGAHGECQFLYNDLVPYQHMNYLVKVPLADFEGIENLFLAFDLYGTASPIMGYWIEIYKYDANMYGGSVEEAPAFAPVSMSASKMDYHEGNLGGAVFEVEFPDGSKQIFTTDKYGYLCFQTSVENTFGHYVITEIQAPKGYQLPTDPSFTLNVTDYGIFLLGEPEWVIGYSDWCEEVYSLDITNDPIITSSVTITKYDAESWYDENGGQDLFAFSTTSTLEGTRFRVFNPDGSHQDMTTGPDGKIVIDTSEIGIYRVIETVSPVGYDDPFGSNFIEFEVFGDGTYIVYKCPWNAKPYGSVIGFDEDAYSDIYSVLNFDVLNEPEDDWESFFSYVGIKINKNSNDSSARQEDLDEAKFNLYATVLPDGLDSYFEDGIWNLPLEEDENTILLNQEAIQPNKYWDRSNDTVNFAFVYDYYQSLIDGESEIRLYQYDYDSGSASRLFSIDGDFLTLRFFLIETEAPENHLILQDPIEVFLDHTNPVISGDNEEPCEYLLYATEIDVLNLSESEPALTVTKSAEWDRSPEEAAPGEEITFTVSVTNDSSMNWVTPITITDDLSGMLGYVTLDEDSIHCNGLGAVTDYQDSIITSVIPDGLAIGESLTLTFTVTVLNAAEGETIENIATVNEEDTNTVEVPVGYYDIAITKTLSQGQDGPFYVGDTVYYDISVENTGSLEITDVVVRDPLMPDWNPVEFDLDPEEVKTFESVPLIVSSEMVENNKLINVASAKGEETEEVSDSEEITISQRNPSMTIDKRLVDPLAIVHPGDTVQYLITVTNTGDTDLHNVVVKDSLAPGDKIISTFSVLTVGETKEIEYSYVVPLTAVNGQNIVNTATAVSDETSEIDDSETVEIVVIIPDAPALRITKELATGQPSVVKPGDTINYKVVVTNIGDVPLTNVNVVDILDGVTTSLGSVSTLLVGESKEYTFSHVVPLSATNGQKIKNHAVTTCDELEEVETPEVIVTVVVPGVPKLNITKTLAPGQSQYVKPGETVNYTITVTNSGSLTLNNVRVTDSLNPSWNQTIASLAIGEIKSFSFSYVVPLGTANGTVITNIAYAKSNEVSELPSNPVDVVVSFNPSMTIYKSLASGQSQMVKVGDLVKYTITVSNTGDIPLTNVVVRDSLNASWSQTIASLPKGESRTFSFEHRVLVGEVLNDRLVNIAYAKSDQTPEIDSSVSVYVKSEDPRISISKTLAQGQKQPIYVGETVTYSLTVTNTGDCTLFDILVTDSLQSSWKHSISELDVGESKTIPFSYVTTKEGSLRNTAFVVGYSDQNKEVEDEDYLDISVLKPEEVPVVVPVEPIVPKQPHTEEPSPIDPFENDDISLTKTLAPEQGPVAVLGESVNFTIRVVNTGDSTLTGVYVTDSMDPMWRGDVGTLMPGESRELSFAHTLTKGDVTYNATNYIAMNTAYVYCDQSVSDQDSVTVILELTDEELFDIFGEDPPLGGFFPTTVELPKTGPASNTMPYLFFFLAVLFLISIVWVNRGMLLRKMPLITR